MGKEKNIFFSALTVFFFLAINIPVVSAQEDVSSNEATEEEFVLEELIVTAERRDIAAQKMPVSVIALSNSALRESGVSNIGDLQGIVPSLTFLNHGNGTFINIRGVGLTEAAPNQTTGVAVHLDGAYVAREFTTDDAFFDLERVEVLRGPQGTYVGQNASGGAIFAVSKSPSLDNVEGYASATFGDYNKKLLEGAVGGPVSDTLAFRVAIQTETRDSFTKNLGKFGAGTLPKELNQPGSVDRYLGRFQLLYQPSEDFDLRLVYQKSSRSTDNVVGRRNDDVTRADPWTATFDIKQQWNNTYDRYTAIANWQATDDVAVKFISSYQEMDQELFSDDDGTSPYVSPSTPQRAREIQTHDEYYTAEVNVLSTTDSKLQWIVGATLLDYEQPFTYQSVNYITTPNYDDGLIINFKAVRKNYAFFGEVSYPLTPTLELKVGARYNKDETELAEGSYLQFGGPNSPAIRPASNSADFDEMSGRILLNWEPNDNNFFYISVARGYKPGGWEPFGNVYDSEIVLNKEIGWKGTLLDRHLITSFDVFHMNYDGFQATFATDENNPASRVTENVDGTTIMGVDLQIQALIDRFELGLNGAFLNTEFGDQKVIEPPDTEGPGNPAVPTAINIKGREINFAPEFSGSIYAKYTFELSSGATLVPRIGWRYQGEQWTSFFQAPHQKIPSYSLGDIRLRYNPNANWYVEAYVLNFTDELYKIQTGGNYPGFLQYGSPRQFGAVLMYKF